MATTTPENPIHRPSWDPETIERFWNYWSEKKNPSRHFFTGTYGTGIVNFAHLRGILAGRVLDYGCGPGVLVRKLLRRGSSVQGLEFSRAAVKTLNRTFEAEPRWLGAVAVDSLPAPLADESFDLIFCIEVIEHLSDDWLDETLREIHRLLRPGGSVVITTPCAEDLESSFTFCPFCKSEFHHVQHMRSITPEELRGWLSKAGLEVGFCQGIQLESFQNLKLPALAHWSFHELRRFFGYASARILDRLLSRPDGGRTFERLSRTGGPHLCAIARKP